MSSLYVDRRDVHLQHDAGAIAFYENGQRSATVPLAPVTRVILRGKVTLEAGLLGHLGERGIGLLFLTGRQGRPSLLLGRAHNDATRRVAQTRHSLDTGFCLRYAKELIHRKIGAQCDWFETLREHYPQARYPLTQALRQLRERQAGLARAPHLDSLRGQEGAAAASYFAGLRAVVPASLGFDERNRRPPRDPFNLETAVGCACQCRDRGARQGATTRRAHARKEEQRRMAPRARCWQVHSAFTQKVNAIEAVSA